MSNVQETVLEINLAHLTHNYTYLKSKLKPGIKLLAVVKAAGYGSDAIVMAKHLEKIGADYFAVAYVSEGIALRTAGIKTPILVLHPQPVNFSAIKAQSLFSHLAASEDHNEKEFTLQQIHSFNRIASKMTEMLGYAPILHQSNTSGILNYPEAHFDVC